MHPSQTSQTLQNDAVYIWVWYSYCATCHQKMLKWTWYDDVIWCWKRLIRSHGMSKQLKRHRKRNSHDGQLNLFETTKVQTAVTTWSTFATQICFKANISNRFKYQEQNNLIYAYEDIPCICAISIFWIKWLKSLSCWCVPSPNACHSDFTTEISWLFTPGRFANILVHKDAAWGEATWQQLAARVPLATWPTYRHIRTWPAPPHAFLRRSLMCAALPSPSYAVSDRRSLKLGFCEKM